MAGSTMLAMRGPRLMEDAMSSETSSKAIEDIGHIAQPVQTACFQVMPLLQFTSDTPITLATKRVNTTAATSPATAGFQSALAATTETSTNISIVSSEADVPSWRVQAHGRG